MDMHKHYFDELRKNTLVMQFYAHLMRGRLNQEEKETFLRLEELNIERLSKFINQNQWDGRYDLAFKQNEETLDFANKLKIYFTVFKQTVDDNEIAEYVSKNHDFFRIGISVHQLSKYGIVEELLKRGHFLHDFYNGFYNSYLESSQCDCLDYLNSAIFYYNEGFDLFHGRRTIEPPSQTEVMKLPPFEFKRIHEADEIAHRSFRESFINLILFVESFINAVGYDAYLKGIANNTEEENKLKGIRSINPKNGFKKYSNFREKLEDISRIINSRTHSVLDLDVEPFKTYLEIYVELRNSYVHSSPEKGRVWNTTEDWKSKCDDLITNYCYKVVEAFWKSSYHDITFPKIIFDAYFNSSFKGYPGVFRL